MLPNFWSASTRSASTTASPSPRTWTTGEGGIQCWSSTLFCRGLNTPLIFIIFAALASPQHACSFRPPTGSHWQKLLVPFPAVLGPLRQVVWGMWVIGITRGISLTLFKFPNQHRDKAKLIWALNLVFLHYQKNDRENKTFFWSCYKVQ